MSGSRYSKLELLERRVFGLPGGLPPIYAE